MVHREYRRAKKSGLPVLVFLKGSDDRTRSEDVRKKLLGEIRTDGLKYKRFPNYRDLQREVRAALVKLLQSQYHLAPSADENEIAEQTIEAASPFGTRRPGDVPWDGLNMDLARHLVATADGANPGKLTARRIEEELLSRGLAWPDPDTGKCFPTAAGIVLLAADPSVVFPQCRILADAFHGPDRSSTPDDQEDIRAPMPLAIEHAVEFVQRNTRHPMRVKGLNRVRLDEYPLEALREALVNGVAHRRYEQEGQKIMLTVFSDRVVIASPGLLPKPLTLRGIQTGNYRPCSRNPLIAQGLSFFHRIEERGSGIGRMRDAMLDHGLDEPRFSTNSGFFEVVLPGPGKNLGRLRVPGAAWEQVIAPSVESQLSDRQRKMAALLVRGEELTSRACEKRFGVTRPTISKDFERLMGLGIAERVGAGRSTKYRLKGTG